jgi:hypothetical protein
MFRCNHHYQGAHYLSLLKLHLLQQSVKIFLSLRCDPTRVMYSSFLKFLDHTQRRTTVGRTPLDE